MTGFYDEIKASSGMYKFYGNGEWKESTSGKGVSILNPTSNEAAYQVQGEEQSPLLHQSNSQDPKIYSCMLPCASGKTPRSDLSMPREDVLICRLHETCRKAAGGRAINNFTGCTNLAGPWLKMTVWNVKSTDGKSSAAACSQKEVDSVFEAAKKAQKASLTLLARAGS